MIYCYPASKSATARRVPPGSMRPRKRLASAVVYCEANFGAIDGKTANGLVRHSELYKILAVIDSQQAGIDAGVALGEEAKGIPICRDLASALEQLGDRPEYFIFGMAPATGIVACGRRRSALDQHRTCPT